MNIPYNLKKVRDIKLTELDLIEFEEEVKQRYEDAEIKAPVHLTRGNEKELIEIFLTFEDAYQREGSSMIIEWGDYYNEK
jgi:hypothetical protein